MTRVPSRTALFLVAVLGLLVTGVGAALSQGASAQEQARRRDERVFAIRSLLQADLLRVTTLVGGFVAWVEGTGLDDPMAFAAYHQRATRYLDTIPWRAVAVAEVLPRDRLAARLAELEDRRILYDAARYPRLEVFPDSDAPIAAPVLAVEPRASRRRVFGFDMASESVRRSAVLQALESARPVLTPPLELSQDTDAVAPAERSVLLLAPVQLPRERGEDQRGIVAFGLTPARLIADAIGRTSGQAIAWELSFGPGAGAADRIEVETVAAQLLQVHILDQVWNVELAFDARPGPRIAPGTALVILLGLLATGFALALTWRLTSERERLREALEARTRDLARTRDAIADAHRVDALGRLTGGVAHDFNNLLGVVAGNLDLLGDALPADRDPELDDFLADALQATERGARLTQRLLTLSRQAALSPEPLAPGEVLEDMAGMLRRTLPATIEIVDQVPAELPRIRADRVQLEAALLNLAINARDAMPDGGRLTLAARQLPPAVPDEAPLLEFSVTDTGTGMAPETVRRALDPFFTTKETGQGTGLGLAIVAGFMAQSGGEVKLDSLEGRGTSVRLVFPTMAPHEADGAIGDVQDWAPVARKGEVVVVIEDNAELRQVLDRQLDALGYEVLGAADGSAGLRRVAEAERVDLVLSDCVLPGDLDGDAIARHLARERPELPVILMSGYADPPAPAGAAPVRLAKPVGRARLAREIRRAIDGR